MKTLVQTTNYIEVDVEIPFYSYVQDEGEEIFVMMTETYFKKITRRLNGSYDLFKCKNSGYIAYIWYKNSCDKEVWDEALLSANKFILTF